ncbi:MAG: oxidoreductase-like domain-containing protein [Massilia sp.]
MPTDSMFPTSAQHPAPTAASDITAPAAGAAAETLDPPPQAPVEPQLEDCCGSGCVVCVFDAYEMARERYAAQLAAWQARHPEASAAG